MFRTFPPNPWSRMNSVADTVSCTFSVVRVNRSAAAVKRPRMTWTPTAFATASPPRTSGSTSVMPARVHAGLAISSAAASAIATRPSSQLRFRKSS